MIKAGVVQREMLEKVEAKNERTMEVKHYATRLCTSAHDSRLESTIPLSNRSKLFSS